MGDDGHVAWTLSVSSSDLKSVARESQMESKVRCEYMYLSIRQTTLQCLVTRSSCNNVSHPERQGIATCSLDDRISETHYCAGHM